MNINKLIRAYLRCVKEAVFLLRRPVVVIPFVLLGMCKLGVLLLLRYYMHPPLSYFMIDIVRIVGGEASLHYPSHLVMLPYLYQLMTMPVIVGGFVLFGWGVFMISDCIDDTLLSQRKYIEKVVWNMPAFLFVGILYTALAISVPFVISLGAEKIGNPAGQALLARFAWLLGLAARMTLVYALLFIKLYRDDLVGAIRAGISFAIRRLLLTVMILLSISIVHAPLGYLTGHSHAAAMTFSPERILWYVIIGIVVEVFTNYFMFAATTYLAIGWKRPPG